MFDFYTISHIFTDIHALLYAFAETPRSVIHACKRRICFDFTVHVETHFSLKKILRSKLHQGLSRQLFTEGLLKKNHEILRPNPDRSKMLQTPIIFTDLGFQTDNSPELPAWSFESSVQSTSLYLRNNQCTQSRKAPRLTTRALSKEIRIWKQKFLPKSRIFSMIFHRKLVQNFFRATRRSQQPWRHTRDY